MDLSRAGELCRKSIHGLLGMDFFAGRVVQIDFPARRLRLMEADSADESAEVLPIRKMHGIMCVPVSVNGSSARWTRLDTGCNDGLHWVVPRRSEKPGSRDVSIGFITDERSKSLTSVQLGNRTLDSVTTALHGEPLFPGEAGLLGNGILSRHIVTIDSVRNQLRLQALPEARLFRGNRPRR
jgi:hypothetical protein